MQSNTIPYQIRAKLLQLEPSLDSDWQESLQQVFADADLTLCEDIDRQILKPKEIHWNRINQTFEYKANTSLAILKHRLTHERMRTFAKTLSESLENLKNISDSIQIADYLENAIEQINQIQVDENFVLHREKILVHRTFLLNAAKIIRKTNIDPLKGVRKLSEKEIKCFIVEVFIKQQLLGYWFKPLLKKHSELTKQPVFRYFVLKEQKIRHFDMVKTSEYIYLVAPVMQFGQNPYSIRRFLLEEQGAIEDQVFLNAIVLDVSQAAELEYIEHFKEQVKRMVTIQSQVHLDVLDIVDYLEEVHEKILVPLLIEPIHFVAKNADVVAKIHLKKFENELTIQFLMHVHSAVKTHLSHIEEFDYLYFNVHRLLSELLAYYREFKEQPSLVFNQNVQMFEYKLLGYIKLLEKRKQDNFVPLNDYEWAVMHERSMQPIKDIQTSMNQSLIDYRELNIYINKLKRESSARSASILKRMMKSDQAERDIIDAQKAAVDLKRRIFMNIVHVPRMNHKCSVFLEFESMHNFTEIQRHYAFPCGDNGLTRLPILLKLPETYADFDVEDFNASISFDLNFSVSSRAEKPKFDEVSEIRYSM
jgi:hypothetical protein